MQRRNVLLIAAFIASLSFARLSWGQAPPLPSWNEGEAKSRIVDFVKAVTDARSKDYVDSRDRIAVFFDPTQAATFEALGDELQIVGRVAASASSKATRTIQIPVCYGGEHGPDLAVVAARARKSAEEVLALHAEAEYVVQAIGFAPGFP